MCAATVIRSIDLTLASSASHRDRFQVASCDRIVSSGSASVAAMTEYLGAILPRTAMPGSPGPNATVAARRPAPGPG
jgi:hypothetical protein